MSEQGKENKRNDKVPYGIIAVLSVMVVIMGFMLLQKSGENTELVETNKAIDLERNNLELDLEDMLDQYDALTVDNEDLTAEIIQQKEELGKLLDKVKKPRGRRQRLEMGD